MLAQVPTDLGFGPGSITQKKHGLLVGTFLRVRSQQLLDLFFTQLLAHPQPCGDDAGQSKGELSVQVNVDPVGSFAFAPVWQ